MKNRIKPISVAVAVSLSVPVFAQENPEKKPVLSLEEVVVTARRTAEFVQDVPIAITAMSADDLKREQINSVQDMQGRIPSLTIGSNSQTRNTETPTIRGQGATFNASPGVILYWDEVALPAGPGSNLQGGPGKFFDLANIQVLKGAQGTLFGRNTTGGAVVLEPNKPQNKFSASVNVDRSSLNGQGYDGVLNLPLVDDVLLLRVGGQYFSRDGFTRDVVTGADYDNKHFWTSRLGLTWLPTDGIENTIMTYYTNSHDNGTGMVLLDTTCGCEPALADQEGRDVRHVALSTNPNDIIRTGAVIDSFSYEITDKLTFRNIASHTMFQHHFRWDMDGSPLQFADQINANDLYQTRQHNYTEELQLQGYAREENLQFVVGGYYEYTQATSVADEIFLQAAHATIDTKVDTHTYAPFAQATYDLGDLADSLSGLNLTLGARYTTDISRGYGSLNYLTLTGNPLFPPNILPNPEVRSSAPTWTAGLDYKFGNHMVYGKISRGYKTGGITPQAVSPGRYTFKPEYVTNYEIGLKSDFRLAGMPIRLNTAAYYTDYSDMQKAGSDAFDTPAGKKVGTTILNIGGATIYGGEFEAAIQPFAGFTFSANYSYTHAQYDKFDLPLNGDKLDCSGQTKTTGDTADLSCAPLQGVARNQGSVSTQYILPLDPSIGDIETSLTYVLSSRVYSAQTSLPESEPDAWLPGYGLLNASISWKNIYGSAFDAQLYGTNLADSTYRIANSNVAGDLHYVAAIYSEPRIIGLRVGYKWD